MNKKRIIFVFALVVILILSGVGIFFLITTLEKNNQKEFLAKNSYIEKISKVDTSTVAPTTEETLENRVDEQIIKIIQEDFEASDKSDTGIFTVLLENLSNQNPPSSLAKEYQDFKDEVSKAEKWYREVMPQLNYATEKLGVFENFEEYLDTEKRLEKIKQIVPPPGYEKEHELFIQCTIDEAEFDKKISAEIDRVTQQVYDSFDYENGSTEELIADITQKTSELYKGKDEIASCKEQRDLELSRPLGSTQFPDFFDIVKTAKNIVNIVNK